MDPEKEFILFLEEHPEFSAFSRSLLHLRILRFLEGNAKTLFDLQSGFPEIEPNDWSQILDSFVKVGLVERVSLPNKVFFVCSVTGARLIEKYSKAKKGLRLS